MVKLYVGGEWVDAQPHWRDHVSLATCPRHILYAAGVEDGYWLARTELAAVADTLIEHYRWVRAERR